MTRSSPTTTGTEQLAQALHGVERAVTALREALADASGVEALLLMPMIGAARALQADIATLASAKAEEPAP